MFSNTCSNIGNRLVVRPDNSVKIVPFEIIAPKNGEVLVETVSTLISAGTELGSQEQGRTHDLKPGYSNTGRIIALGDQVEGFSLGDRVLSKGSHASHVTVSTAPQSLVKLPDEVSFDHGAYGVLGSVSMHGIRKACIEIGEFAVITGMGLVGQLALQLAAKSGCEILVAVDLVVERLEISECNGATHILNFNQCDLQTEIVAITEGRGIDVVVEASGYPDVLPALFDMSRVGGRIMLLGSIWHRKVEVDFMDFHEKELTMVGCHQPKCPTTATPAFPWTQQYNRRQILTMIGRKELDVESLTSHRLPYTDAQEAYRLLREEREKSLGIILKWQ